ncbi:MAG TPA: SUMF1/EgtB/PvdO family nonheme iron enzyme [Planctomycetaceae bacterium]|nr:SUMF1/EgtB/PvdO family nonheme iron enzyme [Planctomycetaceae bacterium]
MSDRLTPAGSTDPRIDAAVREYLERIDRGEPVDREKFLAGHAPIAEELRSFIAAEDDLRKLAGAETPLQHTDDSTKSFVGHGQETIVPQSVAKRNVESHESGLSGQFGRYRIIRALGKGAMGAVYLAEDTQLKRSVAIKTPHFTENRSEEALERFYREARVAATLRHTNICPVFDVGQIEGKHYISMAYIEGHSLSAFIQPDKPQAERQILIVIRKLALALQEAHEHGIVHRDLKRANIMVDKRGEPIIMDFGLAQEARREGDIRLTQTGNIIGTPAYMSPEQVEGELDKIGPSTDQYSLGVILYELLTGQLPFRGSVIAVMGQILTKEVSPPSQSRADLDLRIEAVCLKMMAKTASERFISLKAVADGLAAILKNPAAKPKPEDTDGQATQSKTTGRQAPRATRGTDVEASQVRKSLKSKAVTESDLASLEELARKCYSRRDFEQVLQIIERISEDKRNAGLVALLEKARGKADEISFLICEIDEADRVNDGRTALGKADALLAIKPGHHRALEAQERYSRYGEGGAARIGALDQFRRPLNEGGWIPWSVLAFGLALFGVMSGVVLIYLGRTVVEIDIEDPGVEVALKGTTLTVTGPDKQSVKVVPGDQELTITCAGLETITKSFSLKKGDKTTVTVSIVNSKLVARLKDEIAPSTPGHEEQKTTSPIASGEKEKKEKEVVKTPSGAKVGAVGGPRPAAGSPEPSVATTASKFFLASMLFGDWAIEGDELVQPNLAVWDGFKPGLIFGLNTLSNYDLTLEVKKTGGRNAMGIFFHWQSIGDYRRFELAGNREMNFSYRYKRKLGRDEGEWKARNYSSNQWYSLKVEARGATFRGYLDGVLQFERTDPRLTHGRIGLYTDGAAARFRRIKLCDPQGKVLLAGLPLLLPGRNKAAPKTDASESLPSLTAGETAAKSNQTQWAERLKTPVISTNSLGIKLALIPPGEFLMGSPKSEVGGVYGELQHPVRISKPFYVGVYEITQSEFAQVLGRNPSFFSNGGGASEKQTGPDTSQHPVEQVTWYDAVEFCNTLSQKERRPPYYRIAGIEREADGSIRNAQVSVAGGGGYRLPTEAQWEYACRAGTTTPFNFGTACNGVECNCNGNSPEGTNVQGPALRRTVPVGSYQPNAWGLYDMSGNVWEWCSDVFVWSYYEQSPKADPAGPPQGSLRLDRGGGWNGGAKPCRSASRIGYAPSFRSNGTGFRLARDSGE